MQLTVLKKNSPGNRRRNEAGQREEEEKKAKTGEGKNWGRRERKGGKNILTGHQEAKGKGNDIQTLLMQYFSQGYRLIILKLLSVCRTEHVNRR